MSRILNKTKYMDTPVTITVATVVNAPLHIVWTRWTSPNDVTKWNQASDDWHTPHARNDLREGGRFSYRMEAKDGSMGFDFEGTYDTVVAQELIAYTIADGRRVEITFTEEGHRTAVTETFEAENIHPVELQRQGWQAILDNFKKYAEDLS